MGESKETICVFGGLKLRLSLTNIGTRCFRGDRWLVGCYLPLPRLRSQLAGHSDTGEITLYFWRAGCAYGDVQCGAFSCPFLSAGSGLLSCAVHLQWQLLPMDPCKYCVRLAFPASVGTPSSMFFHSVYLSFFLLQLCQHLHGFWETLSVFCFLSSECTVHLGSKSHVKDYHKL